MIIAAFFQGPYDGKRLVLPTTTPWPRFVIPNFENTIDIEYFYLYAGELDGALHSYLFDDSYGGITSDERLAC